MLFMNYSILWVTEFSFCCKYTAALLQNSWSAPCVYVHIFTISLSPMHTCKLMHYAVAYVLRDLHVTVLWAHWALDWILINLMTILTPRFLWSWALLSQTRLSQDKSQSKRPEFTHNSILANVQLVLPLQSSVVRHLIDVSLSLAGCVFSGCCCVRLVWHALIMH